MRKFTLRYPSLIVKRGFTSFFQNKTVFIAFLSILVYASGYAQTRSPEDKIDPAFRFVMAQSAPGGRQVPLQFSPAFKTTPTPVTLAAGQTPEERYDCIVYTSDVQALRNSGILVNSVLPHFVTAWATLEQIARLSYQPGVQYIAAPVMDELHNDIAVASTGAALLHQGKLNNTVYKGKGVIVAIFDSGIDWKHPDFRDAADTTKSRILRIWDQTITPIAGEVSPAGMGYGVEYTQAQIDDELDGTPTGYVRERDINGHGTHVAGTAAGNGAAIPATRKHAGMAPEADIVVIKGGNGSFSNTNIINGITYLKNLATAMGKPVVLNMSLGSQFGPHDGTREYELAVDAFTASAPGRAVVISAGNDNGANMHNELSLAGGGSGTVTFTVPAGTAGADVFEYRVYVNDSSALTATFTDPAGTSMVTGTPGQSAFGFLLNDNFYAYVSNLVEAGNGDRYIDVFLARNGSNTASPAGTWTLSLTNNTANALSLHGWLFYKNALYAATALSGANNDYMVGSPGNATTAITAASYVAKPSWYSYAFPGGFISTVARMDAISTFSSHGPRRDGVLKPEIAAMGQHVVSAFSSSSAAAVSDIVFPGRYRKNQGTSMSAPVVTGAVALLLQANPTATVSQIRTTLFANTTTDSITESAGATPNTTWGYGRLDIYKAVGALFNCSPVTRKTYQYDASNISSQDAGITLTTQRIGVRFTPDISGRMAGTYYHPSTTKTALVLEVRADSAGMPGALLGKMPLPDTTVSAFAWNYVDLSGLNIPVTSGTDYYMVIYRDSTSAANWSLRRENTSLDNRSLLSTDGVSWTAQAFDYKIRSVVYSNPQLTGNLVMTNSSITRDIATTNLFIDSNCRLIARIAQAGTAAVSGNVTAKVWKESKVPHDCGIPFVARHYEMAPASNGASATGRITLFFTQAEFNAFNADVLSFLNLPANPGDNAGKANLRIAKYDGTTGNGTGLPCSYSGDATLIDPADSNIVWNADASRWEVTFNVTGFGGFVVQTHRSIFSVVENFNGRQQGRGNVLNWLFTCIRKWVTFDVESSANGTDFTSVGRKGGWDACNNAFTFNHDRPQDGKNYYRIKVTDNGSVSYSNTIVLETEKVSATTLFPNVIKKGASVKVTLAESEGTLTIIDAMGRQVFSRTLTAGMQPITLPISESGMYYYNIQNSKGKLSSGKLIVQ